MTRQYYGTGVKETEQDGKWVYRTERFIIEAEDRTAAEWKVREMGYTPISVTRF